MYKNSGFTYGAIVARFWEVPCAKIYPSSVHRPTNGARLQHLDGHRIGLATKIEGYKRNFRNIGKIKDPVETHTFVGRRRYGGCRSLDDAVVGGTRALQAAPRRMDDAYFTSFPGPCGDSWKIKYAYYIYTRKIFWNRKFADILGGGDRR
ncbi:hypothetical protein ABEB36_002695 [Hypothenemus hampei]|uniref:Uncharacterized protein n=1 Tax=Hypothenemus hampei TaxID=57062 RepID=A0ABD1F6P4_HYPHA